MSERQHDFYIGFLGATASSFQAGNMDGAAGFMRIMYQPFVKILLQTKSFLQASNGVRPGIIKTYVKYTLEKLLVKYGFYFTSKQVESRYYDFWTAFILKDSKIQQIMQQQSGVQ